MLKRFTCLLLISLCSCIDPVDFKFNDQLEHLVVEAKFTNQPAVNYVKLSRSSPYDYIYDQLVEGASVYITSEEGEYIEFLPKKSGYYYPDPEIKGSIGHTYTLHIVTSAGKNYQSSPVTIKEEVTIDSVYFKYDEVWTVIPGKRDKELLPGYKVLIDFQDPAGQDNFYRWSYQSLYEVHTQPWDHVKIVPPLGDVPDPKDCCEICYVKESEEMLVVHSDRLTNGQKVIRQEIFFIPFQKFLTNKYKLQLYQHSISQEAFNFFKVIAEQHESTGTVFDPPPSEAKGNIFSVDNEEEQVIGIFDAAALSSIEITLNRQEIPYEVPFFFYPDDCREMKNATTAKPEGW